MSWAWIYKMIHLHLDTKIQQQNVDIFKVCRIYLVIDSNAEIDWW